jgi:hypothetical protein
MVAKLGMKKSDELKKLITITPIAIESKEEDASLPESADDQDLFTKT